MNPEEAKLILQAYRPGGPDESDPMFTEALALAQRDPELQKWLAREQGLDSLVRRRLQQAVPVPLGLKTRLLAQRKAVRPQRWWQAPLLPAVAACLVMLTALSALWLALPARPKFGELRELLVDNSLQEGTHLGHLDHDLPQIQNWLADQHAPAHFGLPPKLHGAMLMGCKIVDWHGTKVTMLCLGAGGKHFDLFVIDRARFSDFTPSETPQFESAGGLATAVWRDGDRTFLLAGHADESDLRAIL